MSIVYCWFFLRSAWFVTISFTSVNVVLLHSVHVASQRVQYVMQTVCVLCVCRWRHVTKVVCTSWGLNVAQTTPTDHQMYGSLQESTWKVLSLMDGYAVLMLVYTSEQIWCSTIVLFSTNCRLKNVFVFDQIVHQKLLNYFGANT